ncbi:potassium channel family protein [Tropicimonas marinistellae]|uniref:potassium channel family protein n=1 Tax=Tropicimonas marinistellae TaxID=1739787 RepID=UPI00082B06F9|nr:potassium channel family protein [Tropicimonas marinistellae]
MPRDSQKKRRHTFIHGFLDAVSDPGVRLLLALTATVVFAGAVVYSFLEGWGVVDSIYFATVTIATVGYGDLAPQTSAGRLFTVGYIVVGIGLFVALASALANHLIRRAQRDLGLPDTDDDTQG